jgi:hypothetical protein
MEYWSVGLKSGNEPDFYSFAFGYSRSKHGLYFSIISTIHHSITPILQVLLTSFFDKKRMTAVYQQL